MCRDMAVSVSEKGSYSMGTGKGRLGEPGEQGTEGTKGGHVLDPAH